MRMRFLIGAALFLLPAAALAQSSAGGTGGGGGGGGGSSGPYWTGQYNSSLPSFANGQAGYLTTDSNGRLILSPGGSISIANFPSSQAVTNAGTFSVQNSAATPAGTNIIGRVGIDQTTPGTTNGVQITNQSTQTTTGAIQPPTAATGKITRTSTALTANTSTTLAAANASRIAFGVQCASGGVSVDETGGALTAAGVGNGTLFIPPGTAPYFTPPVASQTALTAYTATAQTCVVTEYLR